MAKDKNEVLVPKAQESLDRLKVEAANETLGQEMNQTVTAQNYDNLLSEKKDAAIEDLGLKSKINDVGWENMTTREAGQVGGQTGGKIGGQMVKKLIKAAEEQMAPVSKEAIVDLDSAPSSRQKTNTK